jgi:hypothetical protein
MCYDYLANFLSKCKNILIQIFLDNRIIMGPKATIVHTMAKKAVTNVVPKNKKLITKAAIANAIPTP